MSGYILLVDDNPNNLRLLIDILREQGYQVRPANSGARALAMVEKEQPDLILLDINMPGMDGYEVCRRLKANPNTAEIAVLFISAHDDMANKLEGFAAGAVDYITKPFQEPEVLARIRTHLLVLHQKRHLASILNTSLDGILAYQTVRDTGGKISELRCQMANPRAAEILGSPQAELLQQSLQHQLQGLQPDGLWQELLEVVTSGQPLDKEFYALPLNRWLHLLAVRLEDGLSLTLRDTSQRKELELALARLAEQDGLTGLANRRVFDRCLTQEWLRCEKMAAPLALIMCDIDHFKGYNDSQGHLAGDGCLMRVAHCLKLAVDWPDALVARYGGEEFGLILPRMPLAEAQAAAEKVLQEVRALQLPHPAAPETGQVTLSLGVSACVPSQHQAAQSLVHEADRALYQAKAKGRNQVCSLAAQL